MFISCAVSEHPDFELNQFINRHVELNDWAKYLGHKFYWAVLKDDPFNADLLYGKIMQLDKVVIARKSK